MKLLAPINVNQRLNVIVRRSLKSREILRRFLIAALVCLFFAPAARAAPLAVPKLEGRVNDYANVIPADQKEKLRQFLLDQEQKTSNQIVVLTIPTLDGEDIEGYSYRVASAWRLGQHGKDNGVLLVVAVNDHKMRIEVGKGLEGVLTDALSSEIIRNEIAPHFRAGDYGGGILAGVQAIDKATRGEYTAPPSKHTPHGDTGQLFFWLFILFILLISHLRFGRYRNHWIGPYWAASGLSGGFSGGGFSSSGGFSGGGFSGGGGSFGGGGASGGW